MRIDRLLESASEHDFWDTTIKTLTTTATFTRNEKTRRFLLGTSAIAGVAKAVQSWHESRQSNETYTINIFENDVLFDKVSKWLTESMDETLLRSVTAATSVSSPIARYHDDDDDDDDDAPLSVLEEASSRQEDDKPRALDVYYDGARTQEIVLDGHRIRLRIGNAGAGDGASKERSKAAAINFIAIECFSLSAKRAVLARLETEARNAKTRRPTILGAMQWGSFRQIGLVPRRPLDSVVLKEGQAERILGDLKDFLKREREYGLLGMPFRRGVLLEGAPGTGKSSVATALAHELQMDVFIINISSVQSDTDLMELVTDIRAGSILLLEDIDVANSVKERSDTQNGVTMSGILNALDGIATPHGIITILTTNHANVIDPAVLRAGRVDLREEIGYIDNYQLRRLCSVFLGFIPEDLPTVCDDDKIVAASVVECFKKNLDDKEAAARDLVSTLVVSQTDVLTSKELISE